MASVRMDDVRKVLCELSENGKKEVSTSMILDALGLTESGERDVTRRQLVHLVRRNEAIRVKPGLFRYNPAAAPKRSGEGYIRVWRAIRAQRGGFTFKDIALITRYSYSFVVKYSKYLLEQGLIERFGKKGPNMQFRITQKGRETRETPFPPRGIKDPFEKEKKLVLGLVRIFFEGDVCQPARKEKIISICEELLSRFKQEKHDEE